MSEEDAASSVPEEGPTATGEGEDAVESEAPSDPEEEKNDEVNKYISGKSFRTYHANIAFIQKLLPSLKQKMSETQRKKHTIDYRTRKIYCRFPYTISNVYQINL